jgi:hypothetical protein
MHTKRWIRVCAAVALVQSVGLGVAHAQPLDKRTYFTFSGPVAIPGVTLPPGKYLFRLADTSSRNVVQVLSADGTKPYAMFFAIRAERLDVPDKPEVRFMETAEGMPAAIQTWWYPGDRSGFEFAYPREQARRLAEGVQRPVLTARAEPPAPPTPTPAPELARVAPSGEETAVPAESIPQPSEPAGRSLEGEIAPPSIAIAPPAQPAQQARTRLPKTASTMPLWGITGLGLLAGAVLLRSLGTRRV